MIYSGSESSSEFFESRNRIQAKIPDLCGSRSIPCHLSIFGNCEQNHLKFNHKEESVNYLPFSISYYSPTVHKVQNSHRNYIFSWIRNNNSGTGSRQKFRIHNTGKKKASTFIHIEYLQVWMNSPGFKT